MRNLLVRTDSNSNSMLTDSLESEATAVSELLAESMIVLVPGAFCNMLQGPFPFCSLHHADGGLLKLSLQLQIGSTVGEAAISALTLHSWMDGLHISHVHQHAPCPSLSHQPQCQLGIPATLLCIVASRTVMTYGIWLVLRLWCSSWKRSGMRGS